MAGFETDCEGTASRICYEIEYGCERKRAVRAFVLITGCHLFVWGKLGEGLFYRESPGLTQAAARRLKGKERIQLIL